MIDDPSQPWLPLFAHQDEPNPTECRRIALEEHEHEHPKPTDVEPSSEVLSLVPTPKLPRCYSIAQVAEMFGRSPRTIRHWIATGRLKAFKVGNAVFVPEAQIVALVLEIDLPDG